MNIEIPPPTGYEDYHWSIGPKPGAEKYFSAIIAYRKHQLTGYVTRGFKWYLKLYRLKLVMKARKVLWKLSNLKNWIYGKLQKM